MLHDFNFIFLMCSAGLLSQHFCNFFHTKMKSNIITYLHIVPKQHDFRSFMEQKIRYMEIFFFFFNTLEVCGHHRSSKYLILRVPLNNNKKKCMQVWNNLRLSQFSFFG